MEELNGLGQNNLPNDLPHAIQKIEKERKKKVNMLVRHSWHRGFWTGFLVSTLIDVIFFLVWLR